MELSEARSIYWFCREYGLDFRDAMENIIANKKDFVIDNYRFVDKDEIDDIMGKEMESDPFMLGCFRSTFLEYHTGLTARIVEALQKAEEYEAIGEYIIEEGLVADMQQDWAGQEGYGPHFSPYDSKQIDDLEDIGYYVFRVQ